MGKLSFKRESTLPEFILLVDGQQDSAVLGPIYFFCFETGNSKKWNCHNSTGIKGRILEPIIEQLNSVLVEKTDTDFWGSSVITKAIPHVMRIWK